MVTGLAAVYAVLGISVAAVGGTFGSIMGNGWLLYAIAFFFLMMGLSLFDVFYFPVPGFISRLQTNSTNKKGFLGTILIGGLLLFLFGFGQGALIILAGIFTGFISRLPKAGVYMETLKKGFAFLIIINASLLFVLVGQNTDFPNLTRLLAGAETKTATAQKTDDATIPSSFDTQTGQDSGNGEINKSSSIPAPDFTLPLLEGGRVTLSSLNGEKGVLLVFFATWCVGCVAEVPEIKKFTEIAEKNKVTVLGVNYKQPAENVDSFKKSSEINYRVLLDADGTVTKEKYGIKGLPHMAGINAKGMIVYRGTALPDNKAEFIKYLKQGF